MAEEKEKPHLFFKRKAKKPKKRKKGIYEREEVS